MGTLPYGTDQLIDAAMACALGSPFVGSWNKLSRAHDGYILLNLANGLCDVHQSQRNILDRLIGLTGATGSCGVLK